MLKTAESGSPHTFPITVFSKNETLASPSNEQLLSFFVYPEITDLMGKISPLEGPLAEALFLSFGNSQQIASYEATYRDGSGSFHSQLFVSGAISGLYSTWSSGSRHLYLATSAAVKAMLAHLLQSAAENENHCEVLHHKNVNDKVLRQYGVNLSESG